MDNTAPSLWELTRRACEFGVYVEKTDGDIAGAFHHPLVALLSEFGFEAAVFAHQSVDDLMLRIETEVLLLSIDLAKTASGMTGSHLVLVFDRNGDEAIVHDNANLLALPGAAIRMDQRWLKTVSNGRGVAVQRRLRIG